MEARVAVVGAAGWAGSRHLKAFHDLGARVVSVVDPSSRTEAVAEVVGAAVLESPAALAPHAVDLVMVALPRSALRAVTATRVHRAHRVLVEKRRGSSAVNAALVGQVDTVDEPLLVGCILHPHPVIAVQLRGRVAASLAISGCPQALRTTELADDLAVVNGAQQ